MHFHLPKAPKNWRELVIEIGIITAGVLIALFLEELIEQRHWAQKVERAQESMRRELLWDNGPQIYYRAAAHHCAMARLDQIRAAVEDGSSRKEISDLIAGYWVRFLTYDSLAHDDATASGVAVHMPQNELNAFTEAYAVMPLMDSTSRKEATDVARLRSLRRTGGPLSDYEAMEVLGAVEALRNDNGRMWAAARWAMPAIKRLGGHIDKERINELMASARKHYGDCMQPLPADWPRRVPPPEE